MYCYISVDYLVFVFRFNTWIFSGVLFEK